MPHHTFFPVFLLEVYQQNMHEFARKTILDKQVKKA